ncbi:MAG: response regulator [Nannocystaceae bacterium]
MGTHAELDILKRQVPAERFEVIGFTSPTEASDALLTKEVDVVIADEDLEDRSGLDWLLEARREDPYTSLMLVANEAHGLDLAVDAINRANICKLLTKPWDVEELLDELGEAASRYNTDSRKDRTLVLSQKKVTRLSQHCEEVIRDRNRISKARAAPIYLQAPSRASDPASAGAANDNAPGLSPEAVTDIGDLLITLVGVDAPNSESVRIRQLMQGCLDKLNWSAKEVRSGTLAAALHHALISAFPGERKIEIVGGPSRHATVLGRRLAQIPGFEDAAAVIAAHHRTDHAGDTRSGVPRAAKLLQILSLFDELTHDASLLAGSGQEADPDFALTRATESILSAAGKTVDQALCHLCLKELIPRCLGRLEQAVPVNQARAGMVLSRTVYAENLALVRTGTALTEKSIEKVRSASEIIGFGDVWISDTQAA